MKNLGHIQSNNYYLFRAGFLITILLFLVSCCPNDGVDRSITRDEYNVSVDLLNRENGELISTVDNDSKISIVFNNGSKSDSISFVQGSFSNRFTFYFDSKIKDEDVASLEIKLIRYKDQVIDFKTTAKTLYQRDPTPISMNSWDTFFCGLNPVDLFLPKAQALSCRSKNGSKITWRSGYLISVNLLPED